MNPSVLFFHDPGPVLGSLRSEGLGDGSDDVVERNKGQRGVSMVIGTELPRPGPTIPRLVEHLVVECVVHYP